jgi:hypothetical protein
MIPFALLKRCHDPFAIHLYACLRRHANRDGVASTDSEVLAREITASPRSFKRALSRLRATGFVQTRRRHRADGSVVGLTFQVFDSDQRVRFDLQATSDLQANFRPPKVPDVARSKEIDLSQVDLKAGRAGAGAPSPCGKPRGDAPTEAQLWTLACQITAERGFTSISELNAGLRDNAARLPGFDYAVDVNLVNRVVNKFAAAWDRGDPKVRSVR